MNTRTHAELVNFIWGICNLLRGPYKRNEYRKVILPLTVLRRFDCVLAETKDKVLAADASYRGGSPNVRQGLLEAASGRPFYNTSKLNFERLLNDPSEIAQKPEPLHPRLLGQTSLTSCSASGSTSISRA